MAPIVIYGKAVQDARNRLRSAQISTMFDVLGTQLLADLGGDSSAFAAAFSHWVAALPPIALVPDNDLQNRVARQANAALAAAQARNGDFLQDTDVLDLFAIGDILRYLGEFFEFGGGADATVTTVNQFRAGLRNQLAFNRANRARKPVEGYDLTEHPDAGLFRLELLDRSTVKYMERFYGPYIGADISGTTTDALDVLAYYSVSLLQQQVTRQDLQTSAELEVEQGQEMVPIATMVLQYHHSLMECGLALSLASKSMSAANAETGSVIPDYNFYDYSTFIAGSTDEPIASVMTRANTILATNLAGRGLIVMRDVLDIQDSPYADVEIGLLIDTPSQSAVFSIPGQYLAFSQKRKDLMLQDEVIYQRGDPSLAAMVAELFPAASFAGKPVTDIVAMNSVELKAWAAGAGAGHVFDDLDAALAGAGADHLVAPQKDLASAVSGPAADAATKPASKTGKAQPLSPGAALLKKLDPDTVRALEKLLMSKT